MSVGWRVKGVGRMGEVRGVSRMEGEGCGYDGG